MDGRFFSTRPRAVVLVRQSGHKHVSSRLVLTHVPNAQFENGRRTPLTVFDPSTPLVS